MRRRTLTLAVLVGVLLVPGQASGAAREFALRFGANEPGAITFAANTLLTCPAADPACAATQAGSTTGAASNDNAYAMTYVDVDDDPTTFDSSTARLSLPTGSQVLFAGLYYGADTSRGTRGAPAPNPAASDVVRLRAPGTAAYTTLTADQRDTIGSRYQGFVDVTAIVAAAGAGDYTVANVQAGTGEDRYAGWSLFVAYLDSTEPVRNLSIFDGFQTVNSSAQPKLNIPVTGFRTPAFGDVNTDLGFVAYEGDRGADGDSMALDDTTLSGGVRDANNFFASYISRDGAPITAKAPDYNNQLGYDAGLFAVDGVLPNDATSAVIRLATRAPVGETYLPGVVTFATELYAPRIEPQKSVSDVDGGDVVPGDVLEYSITVRNNGQDGARQLVLRDQVPDRTTYLSGGEYDATTNSVVFDVGDLAPDVERTFTFQVTIDAPLPAQTVIANSATATFFSQTLGLPLSTSSQRVLTPVLTPNLALDKIHSGDLTAGGSGSFAIVVTNTGAAATDGTITVTDALDPSLTLTSIDAPGWTCTPPPTTTVTCTRTDALASGGAYPAIALNVDVGIGAPGNLANTATVSGGGDGDPSDNSDTDLATVTPPPQANLSVTKTVSSGRIRVGETATYEIVVRNSGPVEASGVTLADALPSQLERVSAQASRGTCTGTVTCAIGSLPVGASAVVDVTVRGATAGTAANTATVDGDQDDPVAADNTATASDLEVVDAADLSLTKTATPDVIDATAAAPQVTYTLHVANAGPATATGIVVDDPLPSQLTSVTASSPDAQCDVDAANLVHCEVDDLAPGSSIDVTIEATVPMSLGGTVLTNGAAVGGDLDDPDPADNAATTSNLVTPAADLEIEKIGPSDALRVGDTEMYTLTVRNRGPSSPATGVTATDTLPDGLTFVSSPSGCTAAGATVTCPMSDLASGAHANGSIVVRVAGSAAGRTITNVASARSDLEDPVPPSNRDRWAVDVAAEPVVSSPAAPAAPAAAPSKAPPDCLANALRIVDLVAGAKRVHLAGETSRANAGRTVTLLFRGRRAGTATVRADGTFAALLPLPPRSIRTANRARYQAVLGSLRSLNLKLARRMRAARISSSARTVTIAGRVTSPLARPVRTVTLRQYKDCTGTSFQVVKHGIRVSRDGRFRTTVPAPAGVDVAYYRALTRVRKTTRNPKTYQTFTLIRGVTVAGGPRLRGVRIAR